MDSLAHYLSFFINFAILREELGASQHFPPVMPISYILVCYHEATFRKVPRSICLLRKLIVLNNSVIQKHIELKFAVENNFELHKI